MLFARATLGAGEKLALQRQRDGALFGMVW
jgi:hypothetical protein